jgi:hypothetical protein
VRREDPHRERQDEPVREHDGGGADADPTEVAQPPRLARPPEQHEREAAQCEADGKQEEAGPVLAAGADGAGVGDRERRSLEREDAERRRECGAPARAQPRVRERGRREEPERHGAAQQMVGGPGPGLGGQERVDDRVRADDPGREPEDEHVAVRSSGLGTERGAHRPNRATAPTRTPLSTCRVRVRGSEETNDPRR